jgi:phage shock protein E
MQRMIIDVREPEEFIKGHVQGAINVPPSDIMQGAAALKDIAKDTEIILYCVSGSRSNVSKQILESQGFTNVINGINKDQVQSKYGS